MLEGQGLLTEGLQGTEVLPQGARDDEADEARFDLGAVMPARDLDIYYKTCEEERGNKGKEKKRKGKARQGKKRQGRSMEGDT